MLLRDYHAVAAVLLLVEFLLAVSNAVLLLIAVVSTLLPNTGGGMLVMLFIRYNIMVRGEIVVKRGQMGLKVIVCLTNV